MKIQVGFHTAQRFGEMTANEVTVDADRLVLLSGGEVVLDVPTTAVAEAAIGQQSYRAGAPAHLCRGERAGG
jgi:hypothetical protein